MKKLNFLIAGFLAAALAAAGMSGCNRPPGSNAQEKFFKAVESGDPKQVIGLLHPNTAKEVDEPILAAWMKAIKDNLGAYKGLSGTDFSIDAKVENGVTTTESKGTVDFEKGTAHSEIVYRDGQIIKFNVKSDKLPDDWFQGPSSTEFYHQRGQAFLTALMSNEIQKAAEMMHPGPYEEMPAEKLAAALAAVLRDTGKPKAVVYTSEKMSINDKEQALTVNFDVQGEKGSKAGMVKFRFLGLQGHLLAFNIGPKE